MLLRLHNRRAHQYGNVAAVAKCLGKRRVLIRRGLNVQGAVLRVDSQLGPTGAKHAAAIGSQSGFEG